LGTRALRYAITCFVLILSTMACSYSFRGSLPGGIRSVNIDQFRSSVTEYGLEQDITGLVVESIVRDGRLAIDNNAPDTRITGSVTYFSRTAVTYSGAEEVQQYKLEIRVLVSMEVIGDNEYLLRDESITDWILYDPSAETLESAKERLVVRISDGIVRRCLSGW
jgi:hypothetical protein